MNGTCSICEQLVAVRKSSKTGKCKCEKCRNNSHSIEFYLSHPHLIPESWKPISWVFKRKIFFWETLRRNHDGLEFVRYLWWDSDGIQGFWKEGVYCLNLGLDCPRIETVSRKTA